MAWLDELCTQFAVDKQRWKKLAGIDKKTFDGLDKDIDEEGAVCELQPKGNRGLQRKTADKLSSALVKLGVDEAAASSTQLLATRKRYLDRCRIGHQANVCHLADAIDTALLANIDIASALDASEVAKSFYVADAAIDNGVAAAAVLNSAIRSGKSKGVVDPVFNVLVRRVRTAKAKTALRGVIQHLPALYCDLGEMLSIDGQPEFPLTLNALAKPVQFRAAVNRAAGVQGGSLELQPNSQAFKTPAGAIPYSPYSPDDDREVTALAAHIKRYSVPEQGLEPSYAEADLGEEAESIGLEQEILFEEVKEQLASRFSSPEPWFLYPERIDIQYSPRFKSVLRQYLPELPAYDTTGSTKEGQRLAFVGFNGLCELSRALEEQATETADSEEARAELFATLSDYLAAQEQPELLEACKQAASGDLDLSALLKLLNEIQKLFHGVADIPEAAQSAYELLKQWIS